MDEDSFIKRYSSEWSWLQSTCREGGTGLSRRSGAEIDDVVRSYLRVSGQLAEARGRYRDAGLEDYLNGVVRSAQVAVYSGAPRTSPGMFRLFGRRYRDAARSTGRFILVAAALLIVTTLGSWVWVSTSADARAGLFPAEVMEAIEESEEGRSPEVVPSPELAGFLLVHNVQVSILAFAFGVTFGIGTLWVVATNGIMLGSIAGAFTAVGKGAAFWAVVLPHGFLELTAICIAAGAGLRIGWALIEPGDRARGVALRAEASDAVLVVLGVIPAFAVAALIESFVSGTEVPDVIEIALGAVIAGAYVVFLIGVGPFRAAGGRVAEAIRYRRPRALISR